MYGAFEKEKFSLGDSSIYPVIEDVKHVGDYYLLLAIDGEDCERVGYCLTVDNRFEVLDSISFFLGGCTTVCAEEWFDGALAKEDTVENYRYIFFYGGRNLLVMRDSICERETVECVVEDTLTRFCYHAEFVFKTIYAIDEKGRFYVKRVSKDPFSTEKLLERMTFSYDPRPKPIHLNW